MIISIGKTSDMDHVLNYASGREGQREHLVTRLGGNLVGQSPDELLAEFQLTFDLAPRVRQNTRHITVNLAEEDRLLGTGELYKLGIETLEGLKYKNCPFVMYLHKDGHTQHLHLITSQITLNGKRVKEWHDHERGQDLAQKLEQKYDLVLAPRIREGDPRFPKMGTYGLGVNRDGSPKLPPAGKVVLEHLPDQVRDLVARQHGQRLAAGPQPTTPSLRAGDWSLRKLLRQAIAHVAPRVGSFGQFELGLAQWGIRLAVGTDGLQYRLGKGSIPAAKLAKKYGLSGLQQQWGWTPEPLGGRLTAQQIADLAAPRLPPPGELGPSLDLPQQVLDQVLRLRHNQARLGRGEIRGTERRSPAEPPVASGPAPGEVPEFELPLPGELELDLVLEQDADDLLPAPGRLGLHLNRGQTPKHKLPDQSPRIRQSPKINPRIVPPGKIGAVPKAVQKLGQDAPDPTRDLTRTLQPKLGGKRRH